MKKIFRTPLITLALFASLFTAVLATPAPTQAIDVFSGACGGGTGGQQQGTQGGGSGSSDLCGASKQDDADKLIKNVINVLFYLVGIIAVIMIIIGGIRYTTSNGDASQIKSAKDTVLYAVVGIVVAILAYAIVNFVVGAF